jgi:chromosome partitioning protein
MLMQTVYCARMGKLIAVVNEKGGVGKTTSTLNLGAAIAETGASVLLVDLDSRADLTLNLGVRLGEDQSSVYDALLDGTVSIADTAVPVMGGAFSVVPCERDKAAAEVIYLQRSPETRQELLRTAFAGATRDFDWVLCDCPPGLSAITVALLQIVDGLIVPQACSFTALHGLRALEQTIQDIEGAGGMSPRIAGILLTMCRRTNHSRHIEEAVRQRYGSIVLKNTIPLTTRVQEAPEYGVPLTAYDPKGTATEAYRAAAAEVIKRCREES